jgi:hypothetical protein
MGRATVPSEVTIVPAEELPPPPPPLAPPPAEVPQIVKPELVTEPSVYHDIVCPALMLTPLGPEEPE